MAKRGKITVKHYLNTRLKPLDKNKYPIYLQVSLLGKTTQVKSMAITQIEYYDNLESLEFDHEYSDLLSGYCAEDEFKAILKNKEHWAYKRLNTEKRSISAYFEAQRPLENKNFKIGGFNSIYGYMCNPLLYDFESVFKENIVRNLQLSEFHPLSDLVSASDLGELYKAMKCIKKSAEGQPIPAIDLFLNDVDETLRISDLIKHFTNGYIMYGYELFLVRDQLLTFIKESEVNQRSDGSVYKKFHFYIENRISSFLKGHT